MSSLARVIFLVVATEFRLSRSSRRFEATAQPFFARTILTWSISSSDIGSNSS